MTTYTTTAIATNAADNTVVVASISNMFPGLPITFSGTTFGGITVGSTYYIGTITYGYPTSTITLTSLPGGAVFALTNGSGSMTATWESGGQLIINTDPPGENLNTAFTKINVNFDQIWAAGPVNSNIRIADNTISTLDTNGDLVLNPNGIGNVVANAHVIPDRTLIRNLGAPTRLWNELYVGYADIANVDIGQLTIPVGNLHILGGTNGQYLQTDGEGNLNWDTIEPAAGGNNTQIQYNNNGLLDASAAFTFNNTSNTVTMANLVTTSVANLNDVSNVVIEGGVAGYVLATDGLGNLSWVSPTGNLSVILDQQINGDGSTVAFGMITSAVDNSVLVAINGVQQLPSVAYTVSGNIITFSEAPQISDRIDIRFLVGGPAGNGQPGGANGSIQFNNGFGLGGTGNLTYNQTTGNLFTTNVVVGGNITASYYYGDGSFLTGITANSDTGTITFANNVISTSDAGNAINIIAPQQTTTSQATGGNSAVSQLLWATNISALSPGQIPNGVVGGNTWGTQISAGNTGAVIASNSAVGLRTWTFGTNGILSSTGGVNAGNINATGTISATGTITANVNISAVGNVSGTYILGNGSLLTGLPAAYGNSDVANYLNGGIGNIIPVANVSYSLGNATNQWLDLWVSNATIYMNSVPITLGAGNVLSVAGNAVVTTTGGSTSLGNIGFDGDTIYDLNGISIQNSDLTHGATAAITIPVNGDSNAILLNNTYGNIILQSGANSDPTAAWTFRNNGNLSLPGGGLLGNTYGDNPNAVGLKAGPGGYAGISSYDQGQFVQADGNGVHIGADYTGNSYIWTFNASGNLVLPGNTSSINYANGQPYGGASGNTPPGGNTTEIQFNNSGEFAGSANLTFDSANTQLNIGGAVSATGNITGNYFIGDGSQLTGISVSANTGNITFNNSTIVGPSFGDVPSANSSVYIQPTVDSATVFQFTGSGNMVLPGNTFSINYANGTPVSLGGNYGNSNVTTLLASFGSNVISTSGNITAGNLITAGTFQSASISSTGNIISGNAFHVILGNATSALRQGGSNANVQLSGSVTLNPDTAASALNGVVIGGSGYLLASNGARVLTLGTNNALTVAGNLTLGGSTGSSQFTTLGTATTGINAILAGPTFTPLANTSAGFVANVNNYTQITFQNKSTGTDATADYILTADNGSDTVNYGDFGIINSGYDNNTPTNSLGNIVFAADTYLYAQGNVGNTNQSGGNLVIGTTTAGKNVKIFAGGATSSALIANISNTGMSVAGNVTASNFVGNITITGNVQGTSPNVSLVAGSYTATFDNLGVLTLPAIGGNEGGELNLGIPTANTTLIDRVKVDVFQDRVRFFDGSTKGAYIDLSQAATGVGTLLNNRVSGIVNAGTFVTMDNIKATVTGSAPRGLSLATVSGSFSYNIGGTYGGAGVGSSGTSAGGQTLTTTPTGSIFGWGFTVSGDIAVYTLTDTTNSRCYRITVQIGASFNNNSIIIERLI